MGNDLELFDGHCDTISRCLDDGGHLRRREGHLDFNRTGRFGRYAQFFALYADDSLLKQGGTFPQIYCEQYALFRLELERCADLAVFCTTGEQAGKANREGKAAAFLSVEGAELFGCSPDGLDDAFSKGVRAVNLTWNRANLLSGSNCQESERGLGSEGRAFVLRMQELGMLVDLSHLSDRGIWDVLEIAGRPVIASHSNSRAICPHRRNLTDAQFTAIIENGGVAGLCMFADFLGENADMDTVTAHLEHFLELGGQHSISIGGDWDGCARLPEGMRGIEDMEKLREHLLRKNYSEELIRRIFYSNLMRVVNEVCTM